jgi:hypothetical protein
MSRPLSCENGGLLWVDPLWVDPAAPGRLQGVELERLVLLPSGHARITYQHGILPKLIEARHNRESSFKG